MLYSMFVIKCGSLYYSKCILKIIANRFLPPRISNESKSMKLELEFKDVYNATFAFIFSRICSPHENNELRFGCFMIVSKAIHHFMILTCSLGDKAPILSI